MKLIAQQAFSWAHRGVDIEEFEEGEQFQADDSELIDVAIREGWATPADGEEAPAAPAKPRAAKK